MSKGHFKKHPKPAGSAKEVKKSSFAKLALKTLLLSFLAYSVFWVACDGAEEHICPFPLVVQETASSGWSQVKPLVQKSQDWASVRVLEPLVYPLWKKAHAAVEPQINVVGKAYKKWAKTPQGKSFLEQYRFYARGLVKNVQSNWHASALVFVEEVLPNAARIVSVVTSQVQKASDVVLPVIRKNVATGAKFLRKQYKEHSPIVSGPFYAGYKSLKKKTLKFYKEIFSGPTIKSFKSQPVVKEITKQYNNLIHPIVARVYDAASHSAYLLVCKVPGSIGSFVWRVLEDDVSTKEWNGIVTDFTKSWGKTFASLKAKLFK